ncbi:hypothetical protein [Bythopirellula polymerisocia]|uniref:hypothetical protein n=1 Tax=Bythopirellula polymerisocia TaxID=2528003 RepID=UPI001E3D8BD1|nr:hypothetical protein [Bythopirellula polymerisocia]
MAKTVPELSVQPADRAGASVPNLRRLCLAWKHTHGSPQALPNGDRRPLRGGDQNWG